MDLKLLLTLLVAIAGWFIAHQLSAKRDRNNKRRELRITFLIDAYRRLEFASRREPDRETAKALESALADIQLLGSPEQVKLIPEYLSSLNHDPSSDAGPLLVSLRNELRNELLLGQLPGAGYIVRVNQKGKDEPPDSAA